MQVGSFSPCGFFLILLLVETLLRGWRNASREIL